MVLRKILPTTLIIPVIYLMMCPAVLKISQGYIDQHVIVKADTDAGERQAKKMTPLSLPGGLGAEWSTVTSRPETSAGRPPFESVLSFPSVAFIPFTKLVL